LERITGKNLNEFSSDMNLVMQAADQVENKGATLAIAGMKDQYEKYVPSIDYEVPEDYVSPITIEAAEAAAMKQSFSNIVMSDSTMIFPDSSTALPDTSSILIDDPNIQAAEEAAKQKAFSNLDLILDKPEDPTLLGIYSPDNWEPIKKDRGTITGDENIGVYHEDSPGSTINQLDVEREKLSNWFMSEIKVEAPWLTGDDSVSEQAKELYLTWMKETGRMGNITANDWSHADGYRYMFFTRGDKIKPDPIGVSGGSATIPALLNPFVSAANYPPSVLDESSFVTGLMERKTGAYEKFVEDFEAFRKWMYLRFAGKGE